MSKTNINRILIPVDFSLASECALEYGGYLANKFGSEILLLHVFERIHTYPQGWFRNVKTDIDKRLLKKKVVEKLNDYSKNLTQKYNVKIKSIVAEGKPVYKIADTVLNRDIDMIVIGTHGASGFEELFVGHTAHRVVNLSPCPVITVREVFNVSEIKSIVLPIDNSLHSRQKVMNLLPIASKCKAVIHILGLLHKNEESDIDKFKIKLKTVERAVKKAGLTYYCKVVKGSNIAVEAMKYAENIKADLLAIMTDHESDMSGTFMGAFAHQIVNHSKVPVLSIKPVIGAFTNPS